MRTVTPHDARLIPPEAVRVFEGIMYDVYHWPQKMYDGRTAPFEMLRRRDTVKTLAVKDNQLVILEEEQPTHPSSLVLPGGRHDVETETELACAKREVLEETGMSFKTWRLLGVHQPNDEIDYLVYIFLATDFVAEQSVHHDGGEKITLHQTSYKEALTTLQPTYSSLRFALDLMKEAGSIDGLLAMPEYH